MCGSDLQPRGGPASLLEERVIKVSFLSVLSAASKQKQIQKQKWWGHFFLATVNDRIIPVGVFITVSVPCQ